MKAIFKSKINEYKKFLFPLIL